VRCPYCKADRDRVIDSRSAGDGFVIRRRRECLECERRYTTYERIEETPLRVVKKDGTRIPFDRRRILLGLMKACEKRPVSIDQLEEITAHIEDELHGRGEREVATTEIGRLVMIELKKVDQEAYVRFASVYREFKDVSDFVEEVKPMLKRRGGRKN
jgi:transcriptional repressor NrdR